MTIKVKVVFTCRGNIYRKLWTLLWP